MYLADEPITTFEDDKLKREGFVKSLSKSIIEWESEESFVIALYGPWGSGKSSVLNLLETELSSTQNIKVVRFDPWYFNSAEQLMQTFFSIIEKSVQPLIRDTENNLKQVFRKYSSILSFIPEFSIGPIKIKIPLSWKDPGNSPETLRNELKDILKKIKGRIVVMIDNLDRLDANELLLTLKLIRLCGAFPNFTFILAFDRNQVVNALENQAQVESEFLEKIIQVDIHLPVIDEALLDNYVREAIKEIARINQIDFEDDLIKRFAPLYEEHIISKLITDLRTAKRYLNAVAFSISSVNGEVNHADFLALEVIRVFCPKVYQEIPKYEAEFTAHDSSPGRGDFFRQQRHAVFQKFHQWLTSTIEEETKNSIEEILRFLFPAFGAYISNPENPPYIPGLTAYNRYESERQQLISSPSHFIRFFRFLVPTEDIPTNLVLQLIESLNQSNPDEDTDRFVAILGGYKDEGRLIRILHKLIVYVNEIDSNGKSMLIDSISNISDSLDWELSKNGSETGKAKNLIIRCLVTNEPNNIDAAIHIIQQTPSLAFAAYLTRDIVYNQYFRSENDENGFENLKHAFQERINLELINLETNIFQEYPDSFQRILAAWRSPETLNQTDQANSYVYAWLEKEPRAMSLLLSKFVTTYIPTYTPGQFMYERFSQIYDVNRIFTILSSHNYPDDISEYEEFAIREFTQLYQQTLEE